MWRPEIDEQVNGVVLHSDYTHTKVAHMDNIDDIKIPIGQKFMGAYLTRSNLPDRGSILMIQEIFGVTPAMRAIADQFAGYGYRVLVPDIYWRLQPGLNLGNGEDPKLRDLAVEYSIRYDPVQGLDDLLIAVKWLQETSGGGRPAVIGFCLGGRLAIRLAARADLSCAISMYGVGLDSHGEDLRQSRCPLQLHFGENDNHNPMEKIDAIRALVAARENSSDEFFTYPTAQHAFYNRFRSDRFDLDAYTLAHTRVLEFLATNIDRESEGR